MTTNSANVLNSPHPPTFTRYQKFLIVILAFLQFTIILDFMILSPLGAILMPALHITPSQFGMVVSVYAFSAGISGFLAGGFADLFDRKKLLLFFYCGFLLGTLLCGMAQSFYFLLAARMVTGVFGGVIGSIVMAIATDEFPMAVRGRVMGTVQTAFAASQVLGIPLGLFIANHLGWHWAFYLIVMCGVLAGVAIWHFMRPVDAHLKLQRDRSPFEHLIHTLKNRRYLQGFAATALLATGGFMLMPFGSAFSVNNLGIPLAQLPMVYMITGMSNFVAGPLIGRLSDKMGNYILFLCGSLSTIVVISVYTRLGVTPIGWVIAISVLMFAGIQARMIASQTLLSGVPEPASRGAFMSINSSVQQISGGIAALLAGMIVSEAPNGVLLQFDMLGNVVVVAVVTTMVLMYRIHRMVEVPAIS